MNGLRILLVDDESAQLDQTEIFLKREDDRLDIETTTSPKEALDMIEGDSFDLVVSDYMMSEMDGLEFLRILRKDRENDIPFIMFTGKGREEVAMEALNLGADRYLKKGGDPSSEYGILSDAIRQEVEHYSTREELTRSEEKFEKLFEENPDPVFFLDKEGVLMDISESARETSGYEKEEIVGTHFKDVEFFPEDTKEKLQENFEKRLRGMEVPPYSIEIQTKEGQTRFGEINGTVLREGDEVVGMIGVARDITEREKMKKRQELISSSLDQASLEVYWITPEGEFVYTNDLVEKRLGYSKDELKNMYVWDIDPNFLQGRREEQWNKIKEGGSLEFESVHRTKDGEIFPVKVTSHYVEHEGEEYEFAFAQEITQRKKAESEREFFGSLLSHDLKNKIRILQGYQELLKEEDLSEGQEEYLEKAMRTSREGIDLINKVRTYRKIGEEEAREISIDSVLSDIFEDLEPLASKENIEIDYEKSGCMVLGADLLKALFSNLIMNSIQHSGCSKIVVSVQEKDDGCTIRVEDNGSGVSDEVKEKIFERGFKSKESMGGGLGLFLGKKIAESYGGSIEVGDSDLGGARFDVNLEKA